MSRKTHEKPPKNTAFARSDRLGDRPASLEVEKPRPAIESAKPKPKVRIAANQERLMANVKKLHSHSRLDLLWPTRYQGEEYPSHFVFDHQPPIEGDCIGYAPPLNELDNGQLLFWEDDHVVAVSVRGYYSALRDHHR